jgi:S-adenosylmethionine decarboxylase proenzyme
MKALGRHILAEYYSCDAGVLNDIRFVERTMKKAAVKAGSTIVDSMFRMFDPHGISGVVVIAESHLAIHTWPEYGYAAVDLFTCGQSVDPWIAYEYLKRAFHSREAECREMPRGEFRVLGEDVCHKPADSFGPVSNRV